MSGEAPIDPGALLAAAVAAGEAGAAVLVDYFRSGRLEIGVKGKNDFVTQADRESEAALVGEILRRFPDHRILAEEGTAHAAATSAYEWVIDPLDGTTNFLHGLPVWAVSIACRRGDEIVAGVVLDPCGGNTFAAARGRGATWNGRPMRVAARAGLDGAFLATGYPFRAHAALGVYLDLFRDVFGHARAIRRCGAAALDLAYTAAGVYEGFFEFRLSAWDIAAGALLIEEAGGRLSDLDGGGGFLASGNVLAGPPGVHAALLACARRVEASEARIDRLVPPGAGEP
ncbi:MAG: inositol monophosphatase [Thermoanaerobaculia bacterium]|nr:inositol monophosphatase [Thermoanaerobaculia bacterium]